MDEVALPARDSRKTREPREHEIGCRRITRLPLQRPSVESNPIQREKMYAALWDSQCIVLHSLSDAFHERKRARALSTINFVLNHGAGGIVSAFENISGPFCFLLLYSPMEILCRTSLTSYIFLVDIRYLERYLFQLLCDSLKRNDDVRAHFVVIRTAYYANQLFILSTVVTCHLIEL